LKESNPRLRQSWEGVYARGAGGNHPHRVARPAVLPGPGRHNPAPTTRNSDNKDSSEEPARGPGPLQRGEEAGLTDGRRRRRSPTPRLRAPAPSVEALPSLNPSSGPRNSSGGSREQLPLIPSACSRPQAAATHSGGRCPTRSRGARRRSAQLAVWRYLLVAQSQAPVGASAAEACEMRRPKKVKRFRFRSPRAGAKRAGENVQDRVTGTRVVPTGSRFKAVMFRDSEVNLPLITPSF
jgi:hypothetical protein